MKKRTSEETLTVTTQPRHDGQTGIPDQARHGVVLPATRRTQSRVVLVDVDLERSAVARPAAQVGRHPGRGCADKQVRSVRVRPLSGGRRAGRSSPRHVTTRTTANSTTKRARYAKSHDARGQPAGSGLDIAPSGFSQTDDRRHGAGPAVTFESMN